MKFPLAKKSVTRLCDSLKSRRKTLLEDSGRAENEEEETSARQSRKGVREECENSREILKRKRVDISWRDLVER
jgi:hypothetical protein